MMNNNKKILVCEWGATMRMVDFYEVLSETPKTILTREIGSKNVSGMIDGINYEQGYLSGYVVANPDEIAIDRSKDGPERVEVRVRWYKKDGVGMKSLLKSKTHGFAKYAYVWDGKPVHYDHCD